MTPRFLIPALFAALMIGGCGTVTEHTKSEPEPAPPAQTQAPTGGGQPAAGTPMTPSGVPNAPVHSGDLQGSSGGGIGQSAKDMARRQAGTAPSSLDQMGGGE